MKIAIQGVPDPVQNGIAQGWKVFHAGLLTASETIECDVVIVGTGAGGGTAAEILTKAGLSVVMLEEGPLRTSNDIRMNEGEAFRDLYQEGGGRTSNDGALTILQGRAVGGSTTVNWTSSFRTPEPTLQHWQSVHGLQAFTPEAMAPWFEMAERRVNIGPWQVPPNANNDVLRAGCEQLGWSWDSIPRNVNGCWNLGYCGVGCPTNAKQPMLVTTIPAALTGGASLYQRAKVREIIMEGDTVVGVVADGMPEKGFTPTGHTLTVRARHTILAGGAINNPGILLRSKAPNPHRQVGANTTIHPTVANFAVFDKDIQGWHGAPQSIYSDHFQWQDGATGPTGFKLEVLPMLPAFVASLLGTHGAAHAEEMSQLGQLNGMIALVRDGFTEDAMGGTVELRKNGSPVLDYELKSGHVDAIRRSFLAMSEIQFAAGARQVRPAQLGGGTFTSWNECKEAINNFSIEKFRTLVGSAHLMGGCVMGNNPKTSVVTDQGRYHLLDQLSIMDGSLFPTSIGANPQLSIYGLVSKLATQLANELAPNGALNAAVVS